MDINNKKEENYEDIIFHPHHVSSHHPPMTMQNRAAQFSPFAALTGYGSVIQESARLTSQKPELSESEMAMLDYKLQMAYGFPGEKPEIRLTYFVPDQKKTGGAYKTISGRIKKLDSCGHRVILADNTQIAIDCILAIDGEIYMEREL